MAIRNVAVKENSFWKKLRGEFKVNQKWEATRSELKSNKTWSNVKSSMDSSALEAQRVWNDLKAERERRKNRSDQRYLVGEG